METQKTIREWAIKTFGRKSVNAIAIRMNVEMAELLSALENLREAKNAPWEHRKKLLKMARVEVADVEIMLRQVMEELQGDLDAEVDAKVAVLRQRRWGVLESGRHQHLGDDPETPPPALIETPTVAPNPAEPYSFKEEGTGVEMRLDRWYIISDAGSAYTPTGFSDPGQAGAWLKNPKTVKEFGGVLDFQVCVWDAEKRDFNPRFDGCNIVPGRDLWLFWKHTYDQDEAQRASEAMLHAQGIPT